MGKSSLIIALLFRLIVCVSACRVLNESIFLAIGVTPTEAVNAVGLPVVVYNDIDSETNTSREKILYNSEEYDDMSVDAYLLVDRNSAEDLLRQAKTHVRRTGYKSNSIVCVQSKCNHSTITVFQQLWWKTMYYVVIECPNDVYYIYNPFEEKSVLVEYVKWQSFLVGFVRIWKNMNGMEIPVSVIQESLSFFGKTAKLGNGLDASFLYEFSRLHNFTSISVDGKNYRFSNLQVWNHQVEFGINSRFIELYDKKFTLSTVIYGDLICLVVKKKSYVRGWDVLETLFDKEVWLCLFAVVFVTNSILAIVCRRLTWTSWFLITIRAMFTVPLVSLAKDTKERMIIGGCLVFSLIFTAVVQAMLYQILRGRPTTEMPPEALVHKYVKVMRDTPFEGMFTVMRKKEYKLSVNSGLLEPNAYTLKCPGYTKNMAYLMYHGSPIELHINNFAGAAFEAGLPDAWYSMTLRRRQRHYSPKNTVSVLSLWDFEVAFFELLFGLIISAVVLLGEVAAWKYLNVISRLKHAEAGNWITMHAFRNVRTA